MLHCWNVKGVDDPMHPEVRALAMRLSALDEVEQVAKSLAPPDDKTLAFTSGHARALAASTFKTIDEDMSRHHLALLIRDLDNDTIILSQIARSLKRSIPDCIAIGKFRSAASYGRIIKLLREEAAASNRIILRIESIVAVRRFEHSDASSPAGGTIA